MVDPVARPTRALPAAGPNSNQAFARAPEVMVIFYPSFLIKTQSLLLLSAGGVRWARGGHPGGRGRRWVKIRGRKEENGFSTSPKDLLLDSEERRESTSL